MSGKKCSSYSFDAAREARRSALERLRSANVSLSEAKQAVRQLLKDVDPAVRSTLNSLLSQAATWLDSVSSQNSKGLSLSSETPTIEVRLAQLTASGSAGNVLFTQLRQAIHTESSSMRTNLSQRLRATSSALSANHDLMQRWGTLPELQSSLADIKTLLDQGKFSVAAPDLDAVERKVAQALEEAERLDNQHQQTELERDLAHFSRLLHGATQSLSSMIGEVPSPLGAQFDDQIRTSRQIVELGSKALNDAATALTSDLEQMRRHVRGIEELAATISRQTHDFEMSVLAEVSGLRNTADMEVAVAQATLAADPDSVNRWHSPSLTAKFEERLGNSRELVSQGDYVAAADVAIGVTSEAHIALDQARQLEDLHEKRLYVIRGLWKVLDDMGFKISEPQLEEEDNLRSRIVLRVDTLTRGDITFLISLQDIESDSCISERFCLSDFDGVSERLQKEFGVSTRFRQPEGSIAPQLKVKGEIDEPTGQTIGGSGS